MSALACQHSKLGLCQRDRSKSSLEYTRRKNKSPTHKPDKIGFQFPPKIATSIKNIAPKTKSIAPP